MCGIFFLKKQKVLKQIVDNEIKLLYNLKDDDTFFYKTKEQEIICNHFNKSKNRGGIPPDDIVFMDIKDYYLGFHRLSINGLNEKSNQPFSKNGIYLICNGEIYNFKELYNYIGLYPQTSSDCEIIIDLYLLYPVDYFIKMLDGVFSFIIYDTRKNITIFCRDPFGVRPMFTNLSLTCVSSELKQINGLTNDEIFQFPPGHYSINYSNDSTGTSTSTSISTVCYFNISNMFLPNCNAFISFGTELDFYLNLINKTLTESVKKRLLSDRPIACLLSGGLDSSLITSLVSKNLNSFTKLETYSIGLKGSTDLKYAKIVADFLKTNHTEVIVTEDEFFNAIPEVIKKIESYDTTTVRASVGNYLISKYISNKSEAKVIFNGDGSDEVTGGYLYFNKAPSLMSFDHEVKNILKNIHYFDVLRSDRSISSCGLEARTPFLDKSFVSVYLSIPLHIRKTKDIEKKLLRDSFKTYLPNEVLYRKKEAFSDGVSSEDRSWYTIIAEKLDNLNISDIDNKEYTHNIPKTKEQKYYRYLFEQYYPGRSNVIPYFWMPKWSNTTDPSARTL